MLKNKQPHCLFVNFEKKEINTKGIGNICYKKYKNENRYKQIQTDRLNGDIPVIKWNFKNYVVNTF
jgi:hypothetical protein